MIPFSRLPGLALVALGLVLCASAAAAADSALATGRALFLHGRYEEARAAFARAPAESASARAIGIARCHRAVGQWDEARHVLEVAIARDPRSARTRAELGELDFMRGDYAASRARVDSALALAADLPQARYLLAELHRVQGRLDEANDAYRWFIRYYNQEQDRIDDPETLHWIGLAAAQYARWNRNSSQFHFLVNTLYPDALKRDSTWWVAHLDAALLFIEKYNRPDALSELDAALATNPRAAEAHAAKALVAFQQFEMDSARAWANKALAIDPRLVDAKLVLSDVLLVTSGARAALPPLEEAKAIDPVDEGILGRIAAAMMVADGVREDPKGTRSGAVIDAAVGRNPHCGEFFATIAASLDRLGRYPLAARYYEEARRRMPQLASAPGELGLVEMRLGDEPRARAVLADAFEADPFNVRVKNSQDVLETLTHYDSLESRHFVIRFDGGHDALLAHEASPYLENDVYPEIVKAMGWEPPERTLIEIFSTGGGSSGHEWFSMRMAGLPFIGPLGACSGRILAITSPNDGPQRYNWARVLKHEFVHVLNLQQTGYAIPRWFTEGLAVRHEGAGHPFTWDMVLANRVAADRLFDLSDIQLGFVRPQTGEDWALAYYQAELYVEYMEKTYGPKGPDRMIAAYAKELDTPAAVEQSFGVKLAEFEAGYRRFVRDVAARTGAGTPSVHENVAALERQVEQHPRDAALLARLARATLESGTPFRARDWGMKALAIDPKQQLAAYVVARSHLTVGDAASARKVLRDAYDPAAPHPDALALLASLTLDAGDAAAAESLFVLGQARFPLANDWLPGLARIYQQKHDSERLADVLAQVAARNSDDLDARKQLARLAVERKDPRTAARWAAEALGIDVTDAEMRAIRDRGGSHGGRP